MSLDLAVLAVLVLASLSGAASGALRQVVQLGSVVVGWIAARHLGAAVAAGLAGGVGPLLGRALGPAILFLGVFSAASLVGSILLRAGALSRAVRTPADRALGALLGAAKAALVVWVLLSALALAGTSAPASLLRHARDSTFAGLAARHDLLVRESGATPSRDAGPSAPRGAARPPRR